MKFRENNWQQLTDADRLQVTAVMAKRGISLEQGWDTKSGLLRLRNEVRRTITDESQGLHTMLDENTGAKWGQSHQAKYDVGMKTIGNLGHLEAFIDNKLMAKDMEDAMNLDAGKSRDWRNSDGSTVKVLGKSDRWSDAIAAPRGDFGFGAYIKAMVMGTNAPEIRAALSEGTDSAGGYTVPSYLLGQIIDAMRARMVCVQAGALTIPLEGAQNTIVRVASDPVAGWRLENADVAESDPTFEGVALAPKSLAVLVKVSRELLEDSLNLEQALMLAFAGSLGAEVDRVALVGSGTAPEPRGVFNVSGINSVSMGTNGAALTDYGKLLDALYELELDNAPTPTGMVMHPRTKRVVSGFADTTGQPLQAPPALATIPTFATTNIPISQTQGTATNASTIIMGDFAQMLLGLRNELRVEILRETFANKLQYAFLAHLRLDVGIAQPKAFCAVKGIIPA